VSSQCIEGKKKCGDGSCIFIDGTCGTGITCSDDAPYKCADNTCKVDKRDCIAKAKCPKENPIRCPDNTCKEEISLCKNIFSKCPTGKPVRCGDMKCYESHSDCFIVKGCPLGFELCEDGTCATSHFFCKEIICPAHLPHKCSDGFCVIKKEYCDDEITGCPYNIPLKCPDGLCVGDLKDCIIKAKCPNMVNCPDGSC